MTILHLAFESDYIYNYLNKIVAGEPGHFVMIFGGRKSNRFFLDCCITYRSVFSYKDISEYVHSLSPKLIILHGLFFEPYLRLIIENPNLAKITRVVVWGGDIYPIWTNRQEPKFGKAKIKRVLEYKLNNLLLSLRLHVVPFRHTNFDLMKVLVLRKANGIITHVIPDYEYLKRAFRVQATMMNASYPSLVDVECLFPGKAKKRQLILGNSATQTNRQIELLEDMSRNFPGYLIICPLGYGDKKYADDVVSHGRKCLGDLFLPLVEMLDPIEYANLISESEYLVMPQKRQQGLGNIIIAACVGTKIVVDSESPNGRFLDSLMVKYIPLSNISCELGSLNGQIIQENARIVRKKYSIQNERNEWRRAFYT